MLALPVNYLFHRVMKKGNKSIRFLILIAVFAAGFLFFQKTEKSWAAETGYVSFTFDDGEESAYNIAYPILKKYNFQATAYITTDWIGIRKFMTWDQVRSLQDKGGWEIGNHSANHDQLWKKKFSARYIQKDLARSQAVLAEHGIYNAVSFAPPYGKWNDRLMNIVRSMGFTSSRRAWIGRDLLNDPSNFNRYAIEAVSLKKPKSFESVKKYIDRAAENKEWLVFVVHGVTEGKPKGNQFSAAELRKIADYINGLQQNGNIEVLTVREAVSEF